MRLPSVLFFFMAAVTDMSAGLLQQQQLTKELILVVGCYTRQEDWVNGTGVGLTTYKFDTTYGSLKPWGITDVGINPIYVQGNAKSTGERVMYVVNQVSDEVVGRPGSVTGYVSALTLEDDGTFKVLNKLETNGGLPIHISLSADNKFVVVSNYAGSVSMFSVNPNGSLDKMTFHQEFLEGSNVVPDRQTASHLHSATWIPCTDNVVVANLGNDELLQYKLDKKNQTLVSLDPVKTLPGSGPRHAAVDSATNIFYVAGELSNTVSAYTIDNNTAMLSTEALQTITMLPSNFTNTSTAADIHLSSNGKCLFASNRGHDSIVMFKIENTGTLTSLGWESSRGQYPRGFTIYLDWLIVANQDSNDMFVFKIDHTTCLLSFTGNSYKVNSAVGLYVTEY